MSFKTHGHWAAINRAVSAVLSGASLAQLGGAGAVVIKPPASRRVLDMGGQVAVFNIDGASYAIKEICIHDGGESASGMPKGEAIVCPRHGARFSVKTGVALGPPAY